MLHVCGCYMCVCVQAETVRKLLEKQCTKKKEDEKVHFFVHRLWTYFLAELGLHVLLLCVCLSVCL